MNGSILLALLGLGSVPSQDFVAARDHGSRPLREWIAELESNGERSLDAVWSLYHADARSAEALAALQQALQSTENPAVRRAIDTVLNRWEVPFDAPSASQYAKEHGSIQAEELLHIPRSLATRAGPPGSHARRILEAALDSLGSVKDSSRALEDLVRLERDPKRRSGDISAVVNLVRAYAGSAYGEAFARVFETEAATTDLAPDAWEKALAAILSIGPGRSAAARRLLPALDAATIAKLVPELQYEAPEFWLHGSLEPEEWFDEDRLHLTTDVVLVLLQPGIEASALRGMHRLVLVTPDLGTLARDPLRQLAERDDEVGFEALRILGHLRVTDEGLRRKYLRILREWDRFDPEALERLPCWPVHDEETLAALTRIVECSKDKEPFLDKLDFAGVTDASRSPIVQLVLSDPKVRNWGAWLLSKDFRGLFELEPADHTAGRVNQLALRIATLRDRGQGFAAEQAELTSILAAPYTEGGGGGYTDYVMWGLSHAGDLGLRSDELVRVAFEYLRMETGSGYLSHADAAAAYLEEVEPTIEVELEVRKWRPYSPPPSERGIEIVPHYVSDGLRGRLAIELVPEIRLMLYSCNLWVLQDLLQIVPLLPRDEDYLLAWLTRGRMNERLWCLELVDRFSLDTPRLRDAVRGRFGDLDNSVRSNARRICRERSW